MTSYSMHRHSISRCATRVLLCCFFLLASKSTFSQASVGFGLRSQFGGMQAFKDIKGFYNENRPWLDNEFSTGGMMNGFEIGVDFNQENYGMSLMHFYFVGSKTTAKGTNNGIDYKRTLKARMWGMECFDIRWTPLHIGQANIGFGAMPLGLSVFRSKTKLNEDDVYKPPYSYLQYYEQNKFGPIHIFAQIHADLSIVELKNIAGVHLQFLYTFGPRDTYDLHYLNREMNPASYPYLLKRSQLKIDNFGVKLLVNFH